MYEVFINERRLIISSKASSIENVIVYSDGINWDKIIQHLLDGVVIECCVTGDDVNKIWLSFNKYFLVIEAAGGLVMNQENILFIFKNNKWDLPKGKVEQEESINNCALREVKEESGIIKLEIQNKLIVTYHTYFEKNRHILKKTHWFLMSSEPQTSFTTDLEEGIVKVEWKNKFELDEVYANTYCNIKHVLESIDI